MSGESSKTTPGTKRKGAPGAKPKAAAKKAKNDPKSRDEEVDSFWNSPSTRAQKSAATVIRTPAGRFVSYEQMMMSCGDPTILDGDEKDLPGTDATEDEWDDSGWSLYVPPEPGAGKCGAVWFPLWCRRITRDDVVLIPEESQWRCKFDPKSGEWFEVPRGMVDGAEDNTNPAKKLPKNTFMANCVRARRPGEVANCRIVVDWEHRWGEDPEELRCILVSTQKCEKGHEWKADIDYAARTVREGLYPPAVSASESDESEEEVVPSGGTSTRPKVAGKAKSLSGFGLPDVNERVATALESHTVLLSLIAERLSEFITRQDEAKELQEDIKELMLDAKKLEDSRFRQYWRELHAINLQGAHLRMEVQRAAGVSCPRMPFHVMQAHANELAALPDMQVREDVIAMLLPPKPKEAEEGKRSSTPVDVSGSADDVTPERPYSPSK